jgi:glycyl-tRNA synthetase beta chain
MPTLLFEIGCEELPASAVREAGEQLPGLAREHLGVEPAELFLGPRRLALLVRDLPAQTPEQWIQGPPLGVGEKAAEGFARKQGVARAELVERDGVLGVVKPPEPIAATLPARLDAIVRGLGFGKSMVWEAGGLRFSRPVRWTLAKLDGRTLVGTTSFGHRFSSGPVRVARAEAYAETLRRHGVEPSLEERRRSIVAGLDELGEWRDPMRKLEEVVNLVESPVVLEGAFDERFLRLPARVVETAMQAHQRYFPLGGTRFGFVANGGDPAVVRAGNERVLDGRLDDASFTFERDVAVGIEGLSARLGSITFFQGGGTFEHKTQRLLEFVRGLGGGADAVEAARLAKADQASELVREFPDLEGHIGAEYARLAGLPEAVCKAIDEQYLPDAAGGPLPVTEAGRILAAADKLDTLTVAFSLGHRPTGSRDPYALRRAAIGLCRLAVEGGVELTILNDEVRDFAEERLESYLDVPVEFVRAARGAGLGELGAVASLARTLAALPDETLGAVHEVYTRAARIADGKADGERVNKLLLREEAEQQLSDAIDDLELSGDPERDLVSVAALAPAVERFFEEVLVMDPDEELRANRLRVLRDLQQKAGRLGDFRQIPRG